MPRPKNIMVYLMDGTSSGKIKASISNWDGIAYKIPRECLLECKDLDAFNQSGVYFLFGNGTVYVGQAEVRNSGKGIHQRILDHENDRLKDEWEEVVIFTKKDASLGRTDLSFLENKFFNMAVNAERYTVHNNNEPSMGTVTEEKESELLEFIDHAELVLGALGYKVFEKPRFQYEKPQKNKEDKGGSLECVQLTMNAVPQLPDANLKIGKFIQTAMRNLSESGYSFTNADINLMCTKEWSSNVLKLDYPFMRVYDGEKISIKDKRGYQRYYAKPFCFGTETVLITKEWYDKCSTHYKFQDEAFVKWYLSL